MLGSYLPAGGCLHMVNCLWPFARAAPGFVRVLDDHHLAIPDRPGNNRLDTLENLLENPTIGLFFVIPGIDETLRVNGRRDSAVHSGCSIRWQSPAKYQSSSSS